MVAASDCPLCTESGGVLLWADDDLRIVRAEEPDWPGFCRVIWRAHVAEMTDLPVDAQSRLMRGVFAVESVLRELLRPAKINLATLGNLVPHLHWHVIPRWRDDSNFPAPIWAPAVRTPSARVVPAEFDAMLAGALAERLGPSQIER